MDNLILWLSGLGGETETTRRDDGGTVVRLDYENATMEMLCYPVFPGIDLIYTDVHMTQNTVNIEQNQNIIKIDYCREGGLECQIRQNNLCLAPGDISVHRLSEGARVVRFPTGHYRGVTIPINLDTGPQNLDRLLEGVDMEPAAIIRKFRLDDIYSFTLRQIPSVEHIFAGLYESFESVQKGYLKVKVLELLLFLSGLEPKTGQTEQRKFSESQASLAKQVSAYLSEHLEERVTLTQLAEHFGVSIFQIKNSFRSVYDTTPQAYIRSQRMRAAAKLLKETDRSVLDIAGQFGYDNASKFAGAFRQVMGVTPTQYRNSLYHKK